MAKQKNLDLVDDEGRTDLHVASAMNNIHSVYLLLKSGANPDQADLYGDTPLHYACFNRNIDLVRQFLQARANVNAIDHMGATPLSLAFEREEVEIMVLLVENGADIYAEANYGIMPSIHSADREIYDRLIIAYNEFLVLNAVSAEVEHPTHYAEVQTLANILRVKVHYGESIMAPEELGNFQRYGILLLGANANIIIAPTLGEFHS